MKIGGVAAFILVKLRVVEENYLKIIAVLAVNRGGKPWLYCQDKDGFFRKVLISSRSCA
jgi:hypothetical protein